jgi:hypothetical protein
MYNHFLDDLARELELRPVLFGELVYFDHGRHSAQYGSSVLGERFKRHIPWRYLF